MYILECQNIYLFYFYFFDCASRLLDLENSGGTVNLQLLLWLVFDTLDCKFLFLHLLKPNTFSDILFLIPNLMLKNTVVLLANNNASCSSFL